VEERDVMEADVLFVGGGVASLSGAIHLANLIKKHNTEVDRSGKGSKLENITIFVLEKGAYMGAHSISGAVMDPSALAELLPDYMEKGAPLAAEVKKDDVYLFTKSGKLKAPFTPPMLNNHGNYVVSLSTMTQWLAQQAEKAGVDIFPGFSGTEIIFENDGVIGIRTGDKGINKDGHRKSTFAPGMDIMAKVTVFGDGSRGNLSKTLIERMHLDVGKNPPGFVVGIKEIWEVPECAVSPGYVIHTVGYPHKNDTYGGGFIYGMKDNHVSIGLMTGLDYEDPCLDPHRQFQMFKLHPFVAGLLRGGKMVQYGAKTAPVGGYFSIPKLFVRGGLIVGDAANLFITQKIKGIHVAMKSGMLAAEAIVEALIKNDYSESVLETYQKLLFGDRTGMELYRSRNFHQAFQKGLWGGLAKGGLQYLMGGRIARDRLSSQADFLHMKKLADQYGTNSTCEKPSDVKYDGKLTFDKNTDVYYSGTIHEEEQPAHLKVGDTHICYDRCVKEYGNPCVRFCPANVYELEKDERTGQSSLIINFSNCLHCKTCDIKDPYGNITWVPPEGEGGPRYTMM